MIESHTAVIERETPTRGGYTTEPYESAWAKEAIFFVHTRGNVPVHEARVQVSPDGIRWCDEGSTAEIVEGELTAIKVRHFGGWLRIQADPGQQAEFVLDVALALKG